jgi:hypothetical protein
MTMFDLTLYQLCSLIAVFVVLQAFNSKQPATAEEIAVAIREDAEKVARERHDRSMV